MKNSEDILLCENSKYEVTHTLWSQPYKMTQKQTLKNHTREKKLRSWVIFPPSSSIVSRFSIIDMHYFDNEYNNDTNGN